MKLKIKLNSFMLWGVLLWLPIFSAAAGLDSLELDQRAGEYPTPLHLKVLSVYEGKLYYELNGKKPTKESNLYKGLIKLPSPKTYEIRFLYENQLGEEKHFGPYRYQLTPPRGYSQDLPEPNLPEGVYDSIITLTFAPLQKTKILYALNDSSRLKEYAGEEIMLNKSATLYFKAVYSKSLATEIFKRHYDVLVEPPRISLVTQQRKFNYQPKLKVNIEKAEAGYYTLDPLAPFSKFEKIDKNITLPEGRHVLRMFAKNRAGMQSKIWVAHFTVDQTPPQVKYFVDTRLKAAVLRINEPGTIYYTTDGQAPQLKSTVYTNPIKLPENGVIPLRFFAVDTMGNESPLTGFRASSDIEPPKVSLSHKEGTYQTPFDITLKCSERCIIKYTLDGRASAHHQTELDSNFLVLKIKKEGANVLTYRAKDEPGNRTPKKSMEFIIDTKPPQISYNILKLATTKNSAVNLQSNEPARIYYTTDGQDPTLNSSLYAGPVPVPPGASFRYFAVDELGNQSPIQSLTELLNPSIRITPVGGIFSESVKVTLQSKKQEQIFWKYKKDGKPFNEFSPYQGPITLQYSGTYKLSYYLKSSENKGIREEMYIIDKNPPQIIPELEKSLIGDTYTLTFKLNEPAIIRYTLDGTDPHSNSAQTMGSILKIEDTKIILKRKGKQVLRYIAIDRANNESSSYTLDLFSPFVTAQPPPGKYNNILSVELASQQGNIIYYSHDSISLSAKSPVYKKPIVITESQELWFFAMDITGYLGPVQRAKYSLNFPPEATFSTGKKFNMQGTPVVFDAKLSIDKETPVKDLTYRWDFNGDGIFDTEKLTANKISYNYQEAGEYLVTLEVEDKDELNGTISNPIKIYKSCPDDMITLTLDSLSFCMDKFEWPNDPAKKGLSSVNWAEASMMCIEKGKRLCTSREWTTACTGHWDYFFSYGNSYEPNTCNTQGSSAQSPEEYSNCKTEEGVFNLVGNLWEWVGDVENNAHIIMGGSYQQSSSASCELSFPSQISTKSQEIGFRCCK